MDGLGDRFDCGPACRVVGRIRQGGCSVVRDACCFPNHSSSPFFFSTTFTFILHIHKKLSTEMSAPPHPISPPPGATSASSGVRRHHTITATSRARAGGRSTISEEPQDDEGWNNDEVVDQDWVGAVGVVGELKGSSLHRQSSLPTRYNPSRGSHFLYNQFLPTGHVLCFMSFPLSLFLPPHHDGRLPLVILLR